MAANPGIRKSTAPTQPESSPLDQRTMDILIKEYDALRDLYLHAESSAQNIFNFYLTLITTVGGGIVLLTQINTYNQAETIQRLELMTSSLLLFAAIIGSVYLSSLTGRYAHMSRYAHGIDAVRRYLIQSLKKPLPAIYEDFLALKPGATKSVEALFSWIAPTGTYQLFVAAVNSLSLGVAVWLFLTAFGIARQEFVKSILTCMIVVGLSFLVYNAYSQIVMKKLITTLNIRVDISGDLPFITGKQ
jgi:hypothetical protein